MRLEHLTIQQLPGISGDFVLEELDPGLNLVVGPNASGKSSIARALFYLLKEPDDSDPTALALEAGLRDDQGLLTVHRTGSGIAWLREGVSVERPTLPDSRFFNCWWLTVEELLQVAGEEVHGNRDARDHEIADRLRLELTGGYDVEALLGEKGPFHVGPRYGQSEVRDFNRRCADVREVERAYEALQRERERIPELEQQIQEGSDLQVRIGRLDRAERLLAAKRDRQEAEAAFEAFPATPDEMERLRGNEGERLEALQTRQRELEEEQRGRQAKRQEAEEAVARTGVGAGVPDEEILEAQQRLLQRAQTGLTTRQTSRQRRDEARAEEEAAAGELGAPEGTLPALNPGTIAEAERIATEWTGLWQEIKEIEARLRDLPEPEEQEDLERQREGANALRAWLRAGYPTSRRLGWMVAVALAGPVAAVLAVLTGPPGLAFAALVLAVGGVLTLAMMTGAVRRERADADRRFRATGVEAPTGWEAATVEARLNEIEKDVAALRDRQGRAAAAEQDRRRLAEREEARKEVEEAKSALARQVGFDPELPVVALDRFVRLAEKVDAARVQIRETEIEIERAEDEVAGLAGAVARFLAEWGGGEAPGPDAFLPAQLFAGPVQTVLEPLDARLRQLSANCRVVREGLRDITEADGNLERIEVDLGRVVGEIGEIFVGAGLESGERELLEDRLRVLEAFRECTVKRQEARIQETQNRSGLEAEEGLLALVESDDEEGLSNRLEEAHADERRRETLKVELTEIRTRLSNAGTDRKLEEALAQRESARTALEAVREHALQAAAGRILLREVKEGHRSENEPAVLQDARERFKRFTRNGWSLELDESRGFIARDLDQGELRGLGELSSATRMQLLLAARMAWTRHLEAGRETIPFFLDEALTTSDPERFHEVASSIATLVEEEGRQIFYLCAQPSDVQYWSRTLGRTPHVIDLAAVRFTQTARALPDDLELPEREAIPAPEDLAATEYAALIGVDSIELWKEPGGVHIFHVLRDDLDLMYVLLDEWGIRTVGRLESLLDGASGQRAIRDDARRQTLRDRCQTVRLWVEAGREGRGRPLDRGVLEMSGAVSNHFIEEVCVLAAELDGDPDHLLERVGEIDGWGPAKTQRLREWCEESGHVDSRSPSDAAGREARVMVAIGEEASPVDTREVIRWLEVGAAMGTAPAAPQE